MNIITTGLMVAISDVLRKSYSLIKDNHIKLLFRKKLNSEHGRSGVENYGNNNMGFILFSS